jgi:hypothetical protein
MPWIHTNGNIQLDKPCRYRLEDGLTITGELVTDQMIADSGWSYIENLPETETLNTGTNATVGD